MTTYHVRGVYQMTFFIDVDQVVEAESEEEAVEVVQDGISAGEAYDQEATWYDSGPEVVEVNGDQG